MFFANISRYRRIDFELYQSPLELPEYRLAFTTSIHFSMLKMVGQT